MSWESQFTAQWQTFLNTVENRMRRELEAKKQLDAASVNSILQTETAKWSTSSQYNGAWLQKLKKQHPGLGEEFERRVADLRISEPPSIAARISVLDILMGLALAVITFFGMRWFGFSFYKQMLGATVALVIYSSVLPSILGARKSQNTARVLQQLRADLNAQGQTLRDLALRAERDSPQGTF